MHSVLEEVVPLPTWTMSPKRLRCLIMYVMPTSMSLRFSKTTAQSSAKSDGGS